MLTTNINIEDRLNNGQIDTVKQIEIRENLEYIWNQMTNVQDKSE